MEKSTKNPMKKPSVVVKAVVAWCVFAPILMLSMDYYEWGFFDMNLFTSVKEKENAGAPIRPKPIVAALTTTLVTTLATTPDRVINPLDVPYENWEEEQQVIDRLIEFAGLTDWYTWLRKSPDQRRQDSEENYSAYDAGRWLYESTWEDFVSNLDLSPQDRRLVEDMLVAYEAHQLERVHLRINGEITIEESDREYVSYEEMGERLAVVLSPEQIDDYFRHIREEGEASDAAAREKQEEKNRLGYTELMAVAASETADAVRATIAEGGDVNGLYSADGNTAYGDTALMRAAQSGHADNVQVLIDAGANLDVQDRHGNTALMLAVVFGGNVETVRALVDAGADASIKSDYSLGVLAEARKIGRRDVVDALLEGY